MTACCVINEPRTRGRLRQNGNVEDCGKKFGKKVSPSSRRRSANGYALNASKSSERASERSIDPLSSDRGTLLYEIGVLRIRTKSLIRR